jgi:protein-S-isoprenylcysteine O-methyltransferase Ste14
LFVRRLIIGLIWQVAIFGGLLFLPAGTFDWWRAWVFLGVVVVAAAASMVGVFKSRPELLDERMKPPVQKGQPLEDKLIVIPLLATFLGVIVFIPLDVFRFHLLPRPPTLVSSLGLIVFIAGWYIISMAFKENAFAAPVVRYQEERRHTVVDTGVYRVVRHPMYTGAVLLLIGMPLWLESYAAALAAIIPFALLCLRIVFEERFLKQELEGYVEYTRRVRWRLIPGLW